MGGGGGGGARELKQYGLRVHGFYGLFSHFANTYIEWRRSIPSLKLPRVCAL